MKHTESQFIHQRCLGMIRESAMHVESWELTQLDEIHPAIELIFPLVDEELVIVSFFVGEENWTIYTTHRLVGMLNGVRTEAHRSDFGETDFGDFKGDMDSPRIETAEIRVFGEIRSFLYETGYASMAPINYFKFWWLKWPVWKETYRIEREGEEKDL